MSHSSKDHDFCVRLVGDLQRISGDESSVWYDAKGGLYGGDSWWRKIMQEVKARNVFIVVLSPEAAVSPWVNSEIDLAWRQKHLPPGKLIIPVLYRPCEVRDDLDTLQVISFLPPKTYETALKELLLALKLSTESVTRSVVASQPDEALTPQKTKAQWMKKGNTHYDTKQYKEAIVNYDRAVQLDPNYAIAYNQRGNAYYYLKEYQKAIADYNRAIELDPTMITAYNGRGNVYNALKEYQKALADYNRAIELDPTMVVAYNSRGNVYYALKEYQKAIVDYNRGIQLDPNYAAVYNSRGNAYYYLKEYQKAIADYNRTIQLDPDLPIAYNGRGNVYYALKEYQQAIADYNRAIQLDPNMAAAKSNLDNTYRLLKNEGNH